jgi:hypothetical protein
MPEAQKELLDELNSLSTEFEAIASRVAEASNRLARAAAALTHSRLEVKLAFDPTPQIVGPVHLGGMVVPPGEDRGET